MDPINGPGRCFKVGDTNNLRRRLRDQALVTCFAGPFSFIATVETSDLGTAQTIESAFFRQTRNRRFMRANGVHSELVLMTRTELLVTLDEALQAEGWPYQIRFDPVYPLPFEVVPEEELFEQ